MATLSANPIVRHLKHVVGSQAARERTDAQLLAHFLAHGEQDAFAALVRRHGPMVWGVCRHHTRHEHDAEDAFQAVFLVLARRGGSIRSKEAIGSWLHGVAYRVAMKANKLKTRRRARERRVARSEEAAPPDLAWRELQALLDEAVQQLPEQYRAPFVLCCLEGRPRKDVARELGLQEGTVSSRIARARRLLQDALTRRGVTLSAALTAWELWGQSATAALPAALVRGAIAVATGQGGAILPATVEALARGALTGAAGRLLACVSALILGLATTAMAIGLVPASEREESAPAVVEKRSAPVDLHGDPLPEDAVARLGTVRFRHGGAIQNLTFTPNGKQVVSQDWQATKVWDVATGQEAARLHATKDGSLQGGFLTPDGTTVVLLEPGKNGSLVRLRRRSDLQVVREFAIGDLRFPRLSPNGRLLSGALFGNHPFRIVEIWDVNEGKKVRSIEAHKDYVWCNLFSPDGKTLVTTAEDKTIRIWDVATGKLVREVAGLPNMVMRAAFSGDGARLATLDMTKKAGRAGTITWASYHCGNQITLWDVATGKALRQIQVPLRPGFDNGANVFPVLTFAPDGKTLVCGSQDGVLHFWDATTGRELRSYSLGVNHSSALAFAPDGKTIALGSTAIRLIDAATGKDVGKPQGHHQGIRATVLTPDGRTAVTAADGTIVTWDLSTGRERHRFIQPDDLISSMQLLPDGHTLAWVDREKTLRLWDLTRHDEVRRIRTMNANPWPLALSPDGKTAAVAGTDETIVLIDLSAGDGIHRIPTARERVMGASFTPDGRSLLAWFSDHTFSKWDLQTRKKTPDADFSGPPPPPGGQPQAKPRFLVGASRTHSSYGAQVSPNGRLIAYGHQENYLAFHDTATGKVVRLIDTRNDGPMRFAFSPDGRMLAWAGWRDATIRLLELTTGKERHAFVGHLSGVTSLAFTPDSQRLVSGSEDTTALVWDVAGRSAGKVALDGCWADLAHADPAKAFRAMRRLMRSPIEAVAILGKHLRPVPAVEQSRLGKLIADLESDTFTTREKATIELERLGEAAGDAMRKALAGDLNLEKRRRLERLVKRLDAEEANPSGDRLRVHRAVEVLEHLHTGEARALLKALAGGAPGVLLTREAKEALARRGAR